MYEWLKEKNDYYCAKPIKQNIDNLQAQKS